MSSLNRVCGEEHAEWLDNDFRRMIQNPEKMFRKYVQPGDTCIDIGCGTGFFTVGLAKLTGPQGKIIAVDLQDCMLNRTRKKLHSQQIGSRIAFHRCEADSIGVDVKADFILTFYMVHETPEPMAFIDEVSGLLKPGGIYFLAEPKFHASKKQYRELISRCRENGMVIMEEKGLISRIAVLVKKSKTICDG